MDTYKKAEKKNSQAFTKLESSNDFTLSLIFGAKMQLKIPNMSLGFSNTPKKGATVQK